MMSHRAQPNWPPVWTQVTKDATKTLRGELGVLKYVHANAKLSNKCFLVIEHEHEKYVGSLIFDDKAFCMQVSALLQRNLGRPIKAIGALDLSFTL